MALYELRVIDSTFQTFNTLINSINYRITIRYYPVIQQWTIDIYNLLETRWLCQGQCLALGTPLLWESAEDIVFFISDISSLGIDPGLATDMTSRIILWAADNDKETLRAFVPS